VIVGIAGESGSGKSTAAKALIDRGFVRGKFAGALKAMLRAFLAYRRVSEADIERMLEGDLKELPHEALNGRTPRHAMQTLGTEWGRELIHGDLWVDTEIEATAGIENLLFDDVRHDNEEMAITSRRGVIVQLKGRKSGAGAHSSENFVPTNPVVIMNENTIEQLRTDVNRFADDLSWYDAA
jgi:hypothetical protein